MISRLSGRVLEKGADHLVVDVHGVGFRVFASLGTLSTLPPTGQEVALRIHTHVREDTLELYGFADEIEELVFHQLVATPSIGCRKAVQILSGLPAEEIVEAVQAGDAPRLARAHGVGKKTAERLVVEMKDRLVARLPRAVQAVPRAAPGKAAIVDELVSGLVNLGYKADAAGAAVEQVLAEREGGEIPELLREALRRLKR